METFDANEALREARKVWIDKRIIIRAFDKTVHDAGLDINLTLVHESDGITHTYEFEGINFPDHEWSICEEIIREHEGVIPIEPARMLWDVLARNCTLEHRMEAKGTLWG